MFEQDLCIIKKDNKYFVKGLEEEPLRRRHLIILLSALNVPPHEIAFMDLEFHEHPHKTHAYFGDQGTFLFAN